MIAHSQRGCRLATASSTRAVAAVPIGTATAFRSRQYNRTCSCKATTAPQQLQPQLGFHIGETTIQIPFTAAQGQQLDAALSKLLQTFAEKQEAKRPKRWEMLEVRFKGPEAGEGLELLEVFCNPNAYATAFDAKLLITIKGSGGLKVMSEGRLSAVKADLDAFLSAVQD